jgi:ribosomal protein S12 methylthiotransferase accessory factor
MRISPSLFALSDSTPPALTEVLSRAQRLINDRVGIIRGVLLEHLPIETPGVYWATSQPADAVALVGQPAFNVGTACATDPRRAMIKAVGESIERYCAAIYDQNAIRISSYSQLDLPAVDPRNFALFSKKQYADESLLAVDNATIPNPYGRRARRSHVSSGEIKFAPMTVDTPLGWVQGHSLSSDSLIYVPAAFVYIPYDYQFPREAIVWSLVSTGLACGPDLASATYRALLEVIERDAFMIMWHNQVPCPTLDLETVTDPAARRLLNSLRTIPVECRAFVLTLDVQVPIILVVLTGRPGVRPLTIVGAAADLNPERALSLALEEACLGFCGVSRLIDLNTNYLPGDRYQNVTSLDYHALAHAIDPRLCISLEFLTNGRERVAISDLTNGSCENTVSNVYEIVDRLVHCGLEPVVVDLTTGDVNAVGFKVVRAVIPGMQPLDIDHNRRYLGGRRLYEVPVRIGVRSGSLPEEALNPYPHPFP